MRKAYVCFILLLGMILVSISSLAIEDPRQRDYEPVHAPLYWPGGSTLIEVVSQDSPNHRFLRKLDPSGNILWENHALGLMYPRSIFQMDLLASGDIWIVVETYVDSSMFERQFTLLSSSGAVKASFALPDKTEGICFDGEYLYAMGNYRNIDPGACPPTNGIPLYICQIDTSGEMQWLYSIEHMTQIQLTERPSSEIDIAKNGLMLHIRPDLTRPQSHLFHIDTTGQATAVQSMFAEDTIYRIFDGNCMAIAHIPNKNESTGVIELNYFFSRGELDYSHALPNDYLHNFPSNEDEDWVVSTLEWHKYSHDQGIHSASDVIVSTPILINFDLHERIKYVGHLGGLDIVPYSVSILYKKEGTPMVKYQTKQEDGTIVDNTVPLPVLLDDATEMHLPWAAHSLIPF